MSFKLSELQIPPPDNESQFESLCLDIYRAEFGDRVQKNGCRGQSQQGVDIFAPDQGIGIQCKKRDYKGKITERELKDEVEKAKKFKPALKRFILAATCRRDAKIQEAAGKISEKHKREGLFSVEADSWEDIKLLFDDHREIYEKHYPSSGFVSSSAIIKTLQSESSHQELNRINDLLSENKPKTAFHLLETFEKDKAGRLAAAEKYRLLTNKASALIEMKREREAAALLIEALQFNKNDEGANVNCATAYLIYGDLENSKKFVKKAKSLNLLSALAHGIEIQIKDKEGQALEDIVSSLPKAIKENHQIASILSGISLKRERHAEAKKWLDVFKQKGLENIIDRARFADMSLSLILARPDVFSGSRAPDCLKSELKEITEIYKKLVTEELAEFNPKWHLDYALALELNGQAGKAIQALQNGIARCPKDTSLKAALSRLSPTKENIALLEKELGLLFSASNGSLALSQTNISEESFDLALMLTDLYFCSGQKDNAWLLLEKIIEAPFAEADRLEARQYKAFRLISLGKTDEAEKQIKLLFEENQNNIFTLILKSKIEGARGKEAASKGHAGQAKEHKGKQAEYLKKAFRIFKDKKHEKPASQNKPYFESKKRLWLRDIQQLSRELYQSEMHLEAEPLLEEITGQNLNHPEIFYLLRSYFKNGKNRQAVDLAERLLEKFPGRPEPATILFHLYQELGNIKKAVQYYESFIQANPKDPASAPIKLDLIHAYINSGEIKKARALLKEMVNPASLPSNLTSSLSIAYARTGSIKKALETQYQNIKNHPGKIESESMYFSLFIFLTMPKLSDFEKTEKSGALKAKEPEGAGFLHPEKAGLDCYVKIRDIQSLEERDIVIEETAEIYKPEHELSKALFGKKTGDKLSFMDKTYQVMEVKSKYTHKHQEIMKQAELQHGSKTFLRAAYISKEPGAGLQDMSKALKKFSPDMSKRQEGFNQLLQDYRDEKTGAGFIAKTIGRHPIEIMRYLASSRKDKWISSFQGLELYDEARDHLESGTSLLLDLFSLVAAHQIKMEESLKNSGFDLYVCQSTIDSLKEFASEIAPHSKKGLLTTGIDEKGKPWKSFAPPEAVRRNLNFWIKVKMWAEEFCRIKPISSDFVLRRERRLEWERITGKEFFDPLLALYNDSKSVFLSEDAGLRALLRTVHQEIDSFQEGGKKSPPAPSVRLFDLIEHLKRKAVIERGEEIQFKAGLIKLNQTYIPINHNILIFLLKEAEYLMSDERFQRGLFFLGPVSSLSGVLHAAADFFIELCQEPALLPYRRQMIIDEALNKISFGRNESARQIASRILHLIYLKAPSFLPLLQNELYRYIIEWRRRKAY